MIVYNRILERLAQAGYTSYRLQKENILPHSTTTRIRRGTPISTDTINTICELCRCQPGDLLTWVPDKDRAIDSAGKT